MKFLIKTKNIYNNIHQNIIINASDINEANIRSKKLKNYRPFKDFIIIDIVIGYM